VLGAAAAGVPLANLAMRRGRRTALSVGWIVAAVGAALLIVAAQWQNVPALVVGLVLTGAGTAAQLQARFAAADLAAPARKGRDLATVVWVGSLGRSWVPIWAHRVAGWRAGSGWHHWPVPSSSRHSRWRWGRC
jgi:MFS family permease